MPPPPSIILPSQRVDPYNDIEIRIQAALTTLHDSESNGDSINIAATAREYEVPASRLRARWKGRQSKQEWPGTNKKLSEDQELAVCQYLDRLDCVGTSARLQMVIGCANSILQNAHDDDGPAPIVSERWGKQFLSRHPQYFIQKQQTIDADRKKAHQPADIRDWFQRYQAVCTEYNIHPSDRYNFDETGFRIGIGRDQWIITRDPSRQAYLASSTNRELITVCEMISGGGVALPPMIIIPGIIHQEAWYTMTAIPDQYLIGTSDTGYSNDEMTMKWVKHFEHYSSQYQVSSYRLLPLDGFGSHCTKEFLEYCDLHHIIVFCLPPHTSHILQPLDVVVFQPYKHYHAEAVEAATRTGCEDFDKCEFLDKIDSIRQQTFKESTIRSAFRATGLIPFNPEIVISKLRESVVHTPELSQLPSEALQEQEAEANSQHLEVPLTIPSLKRQSDALLDEANNLSPGFQKRLKMVIQGGLTQAQSGALAMEHLEHTKAAEHARNARRRTQNRRQIQKGGVIYASEARQMVKRKEDAEVEKAEKQLVRAQNAQKRAERLERKPLLDAMKAFVKARQTTQAYKKKVSKLIITGIKRQVRLGKINVN